MKTIVTQMAAISSAMRMLLASHPVAKPAELVIGASNQVDQSLYDLMMHHATNRRSTFLTLFDIDGETAFPKQIMIVDGATIKSQINICSGAFIQKVDGSFAFTTISTNSPYE